MLLGMHYPIPDVLSPYVQDLWTTEDGVLSPAAPYRVLPGLGPVLGFQLSGRLQVQRVDGLRPLATAGITGLLSEPRYFQPTGPTASVLVRFSAFGAWALLGCAMNEIADAHVPLDELLPGIAEIEARLAEASNAGDAVKLVAAWLLEMHRRRGRAVHPELRGAIQCIASRHGREPVERVADRVGMGRRQLERLFRIQVGVSPKEFSSLARFNWVIDNLDQRRSWADVADAAGYADQAHFVRSFQRRAGAVPTEYVRDRGASRFPGDLG